MPQRGPANARPHAAAVEMLARAGLVLQQRPALQVLQGPFCKFNRPPGLVRPPPPKISTLSSSIATELQLHPGVKARPKAQPAQPPAGSA